MINWLESFHILTGKIIHRLKVERKRSSQFPFLEDVLCKDLDIVLVCSTGRSGTKFLSELINKNIKEADCSHEPRPEFFYNQNSLFHRLNPSMTRYFLTSRMEGLLYSYWNKKIYVEISTKSTVLLEELIETFPKLKILHLWRDPLAFVNSSMNRGYYTTNRVSESRIYPSLDRSWKADFSVEDKCVWNWITTNKFIYENSKRIPSERLLTVKSEDLFDSSDIQKNVLRFIAGNDTNIKLKVPGRLNESRAVCSREISTFNSRFHRDVHELLNQLENKQ